MNRVYVMSGCTVLDHLCCSTRNTVHVFLFVVVLVQLEAQPRSEARLHSFCPLIVIDYFYGQVSPINLLNLVSFLPKSIIAATLPHKYYVSPGTIKPIKAKRLPLKDNYYG